MLKTGIITKKGIALNNKVQLGDAGIEFTKAEFGSGIHTDASKLELSEELKNSQQSIHFSSIEKADYQTVKLRAVATNEDVAEGYDIMEVGIFARDPDEGEILYSIAISDPDKKDYMPSFAEMEGYSMAFETFSSVSNVDKAVVKVSKEAMATAEDLKALEEKIGTKVTISGGDISGTNILSLDIIDTEFPIPGAGESVKTFSGKVRKFLQDFSDFKGRILTADMLANDTSTDRTDVPLAAAAAKSLQDQVNALNGGMATLNHTAIVTLTAAGWTGSQAPYAQTVDVEGATADMEAILVSALPDGASAAMQKAYSKAFGIISSGTAAVGDGTATFKAYKKPDVDCAVGLKGV